MSDKSPLFVSALELLAHSTELFAQKNPKKYKFVILHLANAIELVVKDCVIDQGLSIYQDKSNRTLDLWECFKKLESKGIVIPERPVIELLVDDRNTIQHRFGYPNAESVFYYLEQVIAFFQRFLNDHYGVKLAEALSNHLSKSHLQLLGLARNDQEHLSKLLELSPEAAIVQAYNQIEKLVLEMIFPAPEPHLQKYPRVMFWRLPEFKELTHYLEQNGLVAKGSVERFETLRDIRNQSAHSSVSNMSKAETQKAFDIAKELLNGLQKAQDMGYTVPKIVVEDKAAQPQNAADDGDSAG
jgi:uncharacterized protein YutE (UPF0331/DUF86 family)